VSTASRRHGGQGSGLAGAVPGTGRLGSAGHDRIPSGDRMSTRRLILAALLCGLAILVAFTVQIMIAT
jgi:hypothetical protein